LVAFTEGGAPTAQELQAAWSRPVQALALDEFRRHPLARWTENVFGVELEAGGGLKRRVPRTLAGAVPELAQAAGRTEHECKEKLQELLNRGGELDRSDSGKAFAFKLHQFVA